MAQYSGWWKFFLFTLVIIVWTGASDGYTEDTASINAFLHLNYFNQEENKTHNENSEVGRFGTGKIGPANGTVIHVRSQNKTENGSYIHNGCDYPFGNVIPSNTTWIALIARGNCSFEKKLENAWKSKAVAMVVYDSVESAEELERMDLKSPIGKYHNIPGVMTYKWKGEQIARELEKGNNVTLSITVGETRPLYNGINRTSVLFVSISFIVLMIISLAWLVFYYVQRFRYLHAKDRLAARLCNAAKKALAKIPTRSIKVPDTSTEGEMCAVCIETYHTGDTLRTLPCKHEFHKLCVDPWLLEHRTCPMCKMDILRFFGFIFTGSQESILHLDMDENILNSSESREPDSPYHHVTPTQVDEQPSVSSSSSLAPQQNTGLIRKPSLISLMVVSAPRSQPIDTSVDIENPSCGVVGTVEETSVVGTHPMSSIKPQNKSLDKCSIAQEEKEEEENNKEKSSLPSSNIINKENNNDIEKSSHSSGGSLKISSISSSCVDLVAESETLKSTDEENCHGNDVDDTLSNLNSSSDLNSYTSSNTVPASDNLVVVVVVSEKEDKLGDQLVVSDPSKSKIDETNQDINKETKLNEV